MAISLSFTDIGNSCPSRKFIMSQICLVKLFVKIKYSQKIPNIQYLADQTVVINRLFMVLLFCEYYLYLCTGYIYIMSHNTLPSIGPWQSDEPF